MKFSMKLFVFMAAILLFAASCQNNLVPLNNCPSNNNNNSQTGSITGIVLTGNNIALSGVEVSVGGLSAYTDSKGGFFLRNVPVGTHVLVNFRMDNYSATQKVVVVKQNKTSYIDAALIPITTSSLNASNGGTINFNGASAVFPANSLVDSKGNPFTGMAQIKAVWFDPTSAIFYSCFPGDFVGTRTDNSETAIESYGFIRLDMYNGTEKLQLASGKAATLSFPLPASMQSKAPLTIPLWYYDESQGKWIEDGTATKNGNNYTGSVKHFSSWNCDQPYATSTLEGKVVDKNGDPISFAVVHSQGIDYTGQSRVQTGDDGTFQIRVKSSSNASIWATYYTFSSSTQSISTPATGQTANIGTITISIDTMNICTIIGRVIDNGNYPVKGAYVSIMDSNGKSIDYVMTSKDGNFKIFGELSSKYILKIGMPQNVSDSLIVPVTLNVTCPSQPGIDDLGDIKLNIGGSTIIGRVVDSTSNPLSNILVILGTKQYNESYFTTDSTGVFSLWVRPNSDYKILFYGQKTSKGINVTSGNFGDTTNIGDITFP